MHSKVTHEFLDAVLTKVAVAAVHLEGIVCNSRAKLCGYFLCHSGIYCFVWVIDID